MAEEVGNALKSVVERINQAAARRQKVSGLGEPPGPPGPRRCPGVPVSRSGGLDLWTRAAGGLRGYLHNMVGP